jgi:hypothetical protein
MSIDTVEPEFVTSFPQPLQPGYLYVSVRFSSAAHICACGCGREVITPLSPRQWSIEFDGKVSVWPSIGNWTFPCRSHYVIERGRVRWARDFTEEEIEENRAADERVLEGGLQLSRPWWIQHRVTRAGSGAGGEVTQ